jgi:NADPH:quinone reductase-like Zn-dependent oxidoreductase
VIAVPVASLRRKPDTLSFDQAASVGVNYMAPRCGLEASGLKAGEIVLLIGAGDGVGSAASQIAKRLGARVTVPTPSSRYSRVRRLFPESAGAPRPPDLPAPVRRLKVVR